MNQETADLIEVITLMAIILFCVGFLVALAMGAVIFVEWLNKPDVICEAFVSVIGYI